MRVIRDAWTYLSTAASWRGDSGIWHLFTQQMLLTVTALVIAALIGLPLSLWLGHLGRFGFLAINISNVGRAVPTFALLGLLVKLDPFGWPLPFPGVGEFGPYGRGGLAVLAALALFALPPIVTTSYIAMREVDDDVKEAARGVGMSGWQRFWRAELPLARPLVVSGLRLALVQVWATATIAALVAGPGLGFVITDGFANNRYGQGIAGAFLVAVVALVLELLAAIAQRLADPVPRTPRRSRPTGARTGGDPVSVPDPKVTAASTT